MAVYGDPPPCPVCMKWHFPQCAEPCGTCKPLADRVATFETALQDLTALIDAADMQDFLSAVRAALAGSEGNTQGDTT